MEFGTKLRKHIRGSIDDPLEVYYQIIVCFNTPNGYVNHHRDLVAANEVDKHYVLMRIPGTGYNGEPFGVVELDKPKTALKRMYEEAKRLGREIAKDHNNKFMDLTKIVE